ncbi:MAG: bifunctional UDP-N-acetylglucosamine diphosphorylase/glucosamine-1-phosphate N-acetyltransferase GlmU [Dehalococcoidia bacterium]|nr:bifunctional UDP-N-acetylglucosamine diphosphorylase/glucosamine-1-phosphate N-acetyltransferase GlmU [Dehalococcoidia bacterium]
MRNSNWVTVILAAGLGKRMKSKVPKALHSIAGKPMVRYVLEAARTAAGDDAHCVVVVGHGADQVKAALGDGIDYAHQAEQLGTGHALAQAQPLASAAENVLVLNGDIPLITPSTISNLMRRHVEEQADLTFLTARPLDPSGLGRVVRDDEGHVTRIVEEAESQSLAASDVEVNAGVYCFRSEWLWPRLGRLPKSAVGEYYLTDLVGMAIAERSKVATVQTDEPQEAMGINDRSQLARAEAVVRERIRQRHMLAGVTIVDPATAYIDDGVAIETDVIIYPNTILAGDTRIGPDCTVGPNSRLVDAALGARCRVTESVVEGATLEDDVDIGPFSHLRPGSYICRGAHIGNFVEVKNSRIGANTKIGHFSYIGDAEVGAGVNIGAGTITCNYDGRVKSRTVIGDGAFIGSDTMLVAPVKVGANARTGAGSVVNRNVPAGELVVGAPARISRKVRSK